MLTLEGKKGNWKDVILAGLCKHLDIQTIAVHLLNVFLYRYSIGDVCSQGKVFGPRPTGHGPVSKRGVSPA